MNLILKSLILLLLLTASSHGNDILNVLNAQRAQLGLYPFKPHPQYQQYAELNAQTRAQHGVSSHLPKGRYSSVTQHRPYMTTEGVGIRSINDPYGFRMLTCEQANTKFQYAGAAAVVGRGGTYYTLIIGNGQSGTQPQSGNTYHTPSRRGLFRRR